MGVVTLRPLFLSPKPKLMSPFKSLLRLGYFTNRGLRFTVRTPICTYDFLKIKIKGTKQFNCSRLICKEHMSNTPYFVLDDPFEHIPEMEMATLMEKHFDKLLHGLLAEDATKILNHKSQD